MADLLLMEFVKNGIHLPDGLRTKCQQANDVISRHEGLFMEKHHRGDMSTSIEVESGMLKDAVDKIPSADIRAIVRSHVRRASTVGKACLQVTPDIVDIILNICPSAPLRKKVMSVNSELDMPLVDDFEAVFDKRAELATVQGCRSFADLSLKDSTMCKDQGKYPAKMTG